MDNNKKSTIFVAIQKLQEIEQFINEQQEKLDFNEITNELNRALNKIHHSILIDPQENLFFQSAFQNKAKITNFIKELFKVSIPRKITRDELNKMATSLMISRNMTIDTIIQTSSFKAYAKHNFNLSNFKKLEGEPTNTVRKLSITKTSAEKPPLTWLNMTKDQLLNHFSDKKLYPTNSSLISVGKSFFRTSDKKIRKRVDLITVLTKRILDSQALSQLGK